MSLINIEKLSQAADFLKLEVKKDDYQLVKSGKSVYNLKKHQLYGLSHSPTIDFFLIPKNNYSNTPFGNSHFFIDFDLPKIEYTIHQLILRFNIFVPNTTSVIMPPCLIIDRVSTLKNSNAMANDCIDWDIFLFNLNKYTVEYMNNDFPHQLGVDYNASIGPNNYLGTVVNNNSNVGVNIELPISLNRSGLLLSAIKDNIVIRIYFKSNISYSGCPDNQIQLNNVTMALRVRELSSENKNYLYR